MKQTNLYILGAVILSTVIFSSCAPVETTTQEYGFLYGLWHGICLPFAVIGNIFGMENGLYALNNSGALYWIGYCLSLGAFKGAGKRSKKD